MDRKRLKRIIAKEGLILLGLGIVLYLAVSAASNIPVPLPKYRLEFENGSSYVVVISPEPSRSYNNKRFVKEALQPSGRLVDKRIAEFVRDNRIGPKLVSAKPVNNRRVGFHGFIFSFLSLNFFLKIVLVYTALLAVRFVVWAAGILRS